MTYQDVPLPNGQVLSSEMQAMFRGIADSMNTMGCSAARGEKMDYDAVTAASDFQFEIKFFFGPQAAAKVSEAFSRYAEVGAMPHDKNRPLCRHSEVPAQLGPCLRRAA